MIEHLAAFAPPCRARSIRSCIALAPIWSPKSPARRAAHRPAPTTASVSRPAPASANFAETAAFMDDDKRILIFFRRRRHRGAAIMPIAACRKPAPAHPLSAGNPGWRADAAIQGLGRSKPHQPENSPPVFRPVATDVKGEKRFLSTIATAVSTRLGRHHAAASARPAARDCSAPTTISKAPTPRAALRQFYQLPPRQQDRRLLAHRI